MHFNDVLGDEGRKALDTCVKVKIYGRPEDIQKYHWEDAVDRLRNCYVGSLLDPRIISIHSLYNCYDKFKYSFFMLDERGRLDDDERYDITDIHDALVNFDKVHIVEKYPNPGPRNEELKMLIDKRRADIEREFQEAVDDPHGKEQYSWLVAQRKVRDCFAGNFSGDLSLLKCKTPPIDPNQRYSIFDIRDAVGFWDDAVLVGFQNPHLDPPSYQRGSYLTCWRDFVREPREEIERELNEAKADNGKKEYSKDEAARRVMKCYPSNCFLNFSHLCTADDILPPKCDDNDVISESYDIFDIQKAIQCFDGKKCLQKYPDDEGPGSYELKTSIEEHSSSVEGLYKKAKSGLRRYSPDEAEQRIRGCFLNALNDEADIFLANNVERIQPFNQTYDIFDIHKALLYFEEKGSVPKPAKRGRFEELAESAKVNRSAVTEEYQKARAKLEVYSWNEAEHRVRDCFAGSLHPKWDKDRDCFGSPYPKWDTDIFPSKEKESGVQKTQQTFDIFEIKKAIDYFDEKHLLDVYLDKNNPKCRKLKEQVEEERAQIREEYAEATETVEIEHGSGFVIHNHFIITNKHVIEDVLSQGNQKGICVSNSAIGELHCKVIHYDAGKDLALLYGPQLNLSQNRISPLQLSTQPLLPGMQIFAFGFPMSHTDETALFVTGHVSGSKKTYSGTKLAVLNCSLNSGNSGGPILCWDKGQLKVVGVATQKHFKEILTLEERQKIEKIRESLETSTISSVPDDDIKDASLSETGLLVYSNNEYMFDSQTQPDPRQIPMYILTLKLYDALETHSQFNLSNALPGCYIVEFIKECIGKHSGEGKEELAEVVEWSEGRLNISPSQLSTLLLNVQFSEN